MNSELIIDGNVVRQMNGIRREAVVARLGYAARFPPWNSEYAAKRFGSAYAFKVRRTPLNLSGFNAVWSLSSENIDALDEISEWFGESPFSIDALPIGETAELCHALQNRGFRMTGNHAVLYRTIGDKSFLDSTIPDDMRIIRLDAGEEIETFAEAFVRCDEHVLSCETLRKNLELQYSDDCWIRYWVKRRGETLAVGISYRSDRSLDGKGGAIYLSNAATRPDARRRGIQNLLIKRRLDDANKLGASQAIVCCKPFSASFRNLQRNGFSLAYMINCWSHPSERKGS